MTEKQIIEGDKLIAEFMGISLSKQKMELVWKKGCLIDEATLSYHSSWDWLMPVVEKIESLNCTVGIFTGKNNKLHCMIVHFNETNTFDKKFQSVNEVKIEAVWLVIVEFLNWYKKYQKG